MLCYHMIYVTPIYAVAFANPHDGYLREAHIGEDEIRGVSFTVASTRKLGFPSMVVPQKLPFKWMI